MAKSGYRANSRGFEEIGNSQALQAVVMQTATQLAGNANAVGDSQYEAAQTKVTVGWANNKRVGATVRETQQDWRDWRDAVLVRVTAAMKVRNR